MSQVLVLSGSGAMSVGGSDQLEFSRSVSRAAPRRGCCCSARISATPRYPGPVLTHNSPPLACAGQMMPVRLPGGDLRSMECAPATGGDRNPSTFRRLASSLDCTTGNWRALAR